MRECVVIDEEVDGDSFAKKLDVCLRTFAKCNLNSNP